MAANFANASAIFTRRPKLLIAVGVALFLVLISFSTSPETIRSHTHKLLQKSPFSTPYTFRGQAVLEDPHLLEDADDFLDHFKAVVEYPSMPISDSKAGCGWPDESAINLQWGYDDTRGDDMKWVIQDEDDYKIELIRKQWQYFVANEMRPWAEHKKKFHGRGIVIPAGHEKSIYRTKVILRMLQKLGSTIDVEIAYWGELELKDDVKQQLLDVKPDLFFNDLSIPGQPIPTYYSFMANFQLKIPAVINSRFAEVILMDSDNIPIIDPVKLFDSEVYKEFGTVFWPDIVRTRRNNPIWAITNTQCRMDEWEQESGQLLVDKRKFWYHLQLATWLETEHRLYYSTLILGDKDMFRFAWHALRTKYGVPSRWITTVGTLSPGEEGKEKVYCGHSFAQHHPDKDGGIAFLHGGLLKTLSNQVIKWQIEHQGGIFQAYKRVTSDQDKQFTPNVKIEWDPAHYLPEEKDENYHTAWCTNFRDDPAHPLDELLPGFQETYKEVGGYWMLDL
ncbi:hypothetical protein AMS68_005238 [Peltaster fructicola]|uniref:Glycosyltransferase family 71 protein n=1 Tax=Peltaster fructicola TaxID=286661 RepID=A0A6H0XYI1_9PEZI|nr:hypothetical protein AMS68_005238 [Peltaster fructicola]